MSAELFDLVHSSVQIMYQTKGSFDITLGQVIDHWGFGAVSAQRTEKQYANNSNQQLQPALLLDQQRHSLRKQRLIQLNLSAIAKGYAVDVISQLLLQKGHPHHLVEIGGEVRANGKKFNQNWRVAIEKPSYDLTRNLQFVLALTNMGMATSGDYRNFVVQQGKKLPHIINPKTNKPIRNNTASVTVLHSNVATADALATAFMVMGVKKGLEYANAHGIAAYFIMRKQSAFVTSHSIGWPTGVVE